jgi:hypothetical protein
MLSKKDKMGFWIIGGVVLVLASVMAFQLSINNKPKPGSDNCVGEITSNTVFLLDYSEEISDQTLDEIVSRTMSHVRKNVKENEKVSVFTISNLSKNSLKPVVSLCRPRADGDRLVENVQSIQRNFKLAFEAPLREALSRRPSESDESPIAQAITDISLSQYLHGSSNSLLIYSDMLENTKKFSIYKCHNPSETIERYRESRKGAMERPNFLNVNVKINLIPRLGQTGDALKCRDKLWNWFFGKNKGENAMLSIEYLPGGSITTSSVVGSHK